MGTRCAYFTDQEVEGLTDDFCSMIDKTRAIAGFPILCIDGHRSVEENNAAKGVSDSPHLFGKDRVFPLGVPQPGMPPEVLNGAEAMDIQRPPDSFVFGKLMWAIGRAGFTNVEVCPEHIHVSNSKYVPQDSCYQGADHP